MYTRCTRDLQMHKIRTQKACEYNSHFGFYFPFHNNHVSLFFVVAIFANIIKARITLSPFFFVALFYDLAKTRIFMLYAPRYIRYNRSKYFIRLSVVCCCCWCFQVSSFWPTYFIAYIRIYRKLMEWWKEERKRNVYSVAWIGLLNTHIRTPYTICAYLYMYCMCGTVPVHLSFTKHRWPCPMSILHREIVNTHTYNNNNNKNAKLNQTEPNIKRMNTKQIPQSQKKYVQHTKCTRKLWYENVWMRKTILEEKKNTHLYIGHILFKYAERGGFFRIIFVTIIIRANRVRTYTHTISAKGYKSICNRCTNINMHSS